MTLHSSKIAQTLTATVAALVVTATETALAHPGDGEWMGDGWMNGGHMGGWMGGHVGGWPGGHVGSWMGSGWMGGMSGWSALWMLVWLGLVVAIPLGVAYLLLTRESADTGTTTTEDTAMATLRERYARGEIDDDEYETMRSRLS